MINLIIFIINLLEISSEPYQVKLQDNVPINMNCRNIRETSNGFNGKQYFYSSLSNNGELKNLDKITFHLWFNVHSKSILTGRQVIFSLIDGYGPDSILNLMAFYQKNQLNQYQLAIANEKLQPEIKKLVLNQTNEMFQGFWNHLLISYDQTTVDLFINIKFFSTYDQQLQQTRDVLPQQKFIYSFGPHSRITNEQLYEQTSDYKACVNIANFYYINGQSIMDSEIYVDYNLDLKFLLRPYQATLNYEMASLIQSTTGVEFSGQVGINVYKNTQIVYKFIEQMSSFTIGFWMQTASIDSDFQVLSLTDDQIQQTSIGFGVDRQKNLLLYQLYENRKIGKVQKHIWQHITAAVLEISFDQNFVSTNQKKLIRVFIDDKEIFDDILQNFPNYKRILIGPVKKDRKREDIMIDIQDIKIFQGFGIITSNTDCLLFVGEYCLFCNNGTHYCKEQDPFDDKFVYNCPAGYQNISGGCRKIPQLNCLRVSDSNICTICKEGYYLKNEICTAIQNYTHSYLPYNCSDVNASYCEQQNNKTIIANIITEKIIQFSKLCIDQIFSYNSTSFTCSGNQLTNCIQAQYSEACYKCQSSYYLTSLKQCSQSCVINGVQKFKDSNTSNFQCRLYCPNRYRFTYKCVNFGGDKEQGFADHYCEDRNCTLDELDLEYICLRDVYQTVGFGQKCTLDAPYNLQVTCNELCKYCFGTQDNQCLGCYDGYYFNPYLTNCLKNCSDQQNRFIYHNTFKKICEYECSEEFPQQDDYCVQQCSPGYYKYKNKCKLIDSIELYLDTLQQIMKLCPDLCLTCSSSTNCLTCINDYPFYNNQCLFNCYPYPMIYKNDRYMCKSTCDSDELTYQNTNFQGYSITQCFYKICGTISVGGITYQTVKHQSNPKLCALPCDDGYYEDFKQLKCRKCVDSCMTCKNFGSYCIKCYPSTFFLNNACFDSCDDKFNNYLTFECEGSCSSGIPIIDKQKNIKACVERCGEIYPDYKYQYYGNCIKELPQEPVFCVDYICYKCNSLCKQCTGELDTNCTECFENYFLNNNRCITDCGLLKYDKINWRCVDSCPTNSKESSGLETINGIDQNITSCYVTCLYQKYQFLDKCYDQQPDFAYCESRTNYFTCEKCSQLCKICTNAFSDSCSECSSSAFLFKTTCQFDCPTEAPYQDLSSRQCVVQCQNYSFNGSCVEQCVADVYINESKKECYSNGCPLGYYNFEQTKNCYSCYEGCSQCQDGTNTKCERCFKGYFLNGGTCNRHCLIHPYLIQDLNNNLCVQFCPTGSYLQQLQDGTLVCSEECPEYYYSTICISSCPNQTFQVGKQCFNCAGPCSVCFGIEVYECTECDQGYYRDGTTCYQKCPPSKPFINTLDQTCTETCLDYLYASPMICLTSCPSFLQIYELNGKKECVEKCYTKSYLLNGQCQSCDLKCKNCFGPNNGSCVECESPYYLFKQTCQLTCPEFYDTVDNVCRSACPYNLVKQNLLCQQQCDIGYLVYNQYCIIKCPTFTFQKENQCFDCNQLCSTCFGEKDSECISCIDNYFLNGTTCQLYCDNFYDLDMWICKNDCNDKLEVTDQKQCVSSCPVNYFLCQNKCITIAPDGYYLEGTQCFKCNEVCETCISSTICTQCKTNYYLNQDQCQNQCSNKYLFMDTQSKTCVTKCSSQLYHLESFGKFFCVSNCKNILNGWCKDVCPQGTYLENNYCKQCPLYCQECESFTNCTKCINGYYNQNGYCLNYCITGIVDKINFKCVTQCEQTLYQYNEECLSQCPTDPLTYDYKMICYNKCPNTTYKDGQSCYECDESCSQCIGPNNSDCIECALSYYLDNQVCTKTCPQFYDLVNNKCVISCPNKMFQDQNNCLPKCVYYQYKNSCFETCPISTYASNSLCLDCPPDCIECNFESCLKCQISTYLFNGLCQKFCPILYDTINNQCVEICPQEALRFLDNCVQECPNNTFEFNNQCLLSCPQQMIPKYQKCVSCPERCKQCKNDLTCTICQDTYFLFEGECYITCPSSMPYSHFLKKICLNECTPDTFISGLNCVDSCNLITFQNQCLDKCPSGYYGQDACKPCKLECKQCSDYDICTVCNDNYYLENDQCDTQCTNIKDLIKKECTNFCDKLLYKNVCYQQCPLNTFEYKNECVVNCKDGYYGSDQQKCVKCLHKCKLCSGETQCSKCNTGFYLYLTNCLEECPEKLFSDPINNLCQTSCPKRTYKFQNQCLFDCPDGYYNDNENYQCLENCLDQQYLDKKTCHQCSIECNGCYGYGNNYCITCSIDFQLDGNGYCVGNSCKIGYYLQNQSCYKCLHKCQTCQDEMKCTKCKGKNRISSDCSCAQGYYDDDLNDDCQKCPCEECSSLTNCLTCKNNLQIPLCSCDRVLNEDWCINCEVAKVNIYFSDDLDEIIVYFGYLVSVNLLNPFEPSSCQLWFYNAEVFGNNATCYLSWDRYSIIIQLKPYSTINVGDQLNFQDNFYRDIDQGICDDYFINTFIENKVNGPQRLYKPYILFTVPSYVSACKIIEVNQILFEGTGKRLQQVLRWQLEDLENEDAYLQMDTFLGQQKNEMVIPIGLLSPNTTYKITVKYINMFERVNQTKIQFTTLPIQAPYIYLSFNPLRINFYLYDCHITFKNMENQFSLDISIIDPKNHSNVFLALQEQITYNHELTLNESLLPKAQQLLFIAATALSIVKEKFVLKSKNIDVKFLQTDRIIGDDNQINARGYDRNIQDEVLSTRNLNYDWLCTNLNNLQPCKTQENQIMQFSSRRVLYIQADNQNTTFAFYVKASKDKRWTVSEQLVVVQSFNMEEEFVLNKNQPSNYINPNDEITIIIKNNQKFAFIMQQFRILSSQKIKGKTLKFRLADISSDMKSPIQIYLIPGSESLSFQLNKPPKNIKFDVSPLKGNSLEYFNYTVQNLGGDSKISIYYYFSNSTLTQDVQLQQSLNGISLITESQQIEGSFQLPNGINNQISLLCVIENNYGAKSFHNQQITVIRQSYELVSLVQTFNSKINISNLNSLHLMVVQTQLEQQQVSLKQCSGVGTCIQNKCQCPPGYYFDDCSGDLKQYQHYLDIIETSIQNLIKLKINNNDDFKQFSQTLLYFSKFNQLIQHLSAQECQSILQQYVNNTNSRLVEINQFTISLQYHTNQDYNYSEIDIRQRVNKDDFQIALDSIVFMWNKTLFSQDSSLYLLQNYMQQFVWNIIDLTLISLGLEEEFLYQIDTAKIHIMKTSNLTQYLNHLNSSFSRVLSEAFKEDNYDLIVSVFLRNFYAYDGYFPYPDQIYPLYDYSIRYQNSKENIKLQNKIAYKFQILSSQKNLVCLTRNYTTYYWSDEFCVLDQIDQTYFCNCSLLAPTTIVNDLKYIYQGSLPTQLILPNILLLVYGIQVALIIGVTFKAHLSHPQVSLVSPIENYKYGKVLALMKNREVFIIGGSQKQTQYDYLKSSARNISQNDEDEKKDFKDLNFNHIWKKHFLLNLVIKKLEYMSLFFRCILIVERINILLLISEILDIYWYENQILLNVCILIGIIILIRASENVAKIQIKKYFYTKRPVSRFLSKIAVILLFIFTELAVIYLYFKLEDQTNIILSNTVAYLCDLLLLDLIWFSLHKYLGEGKKKMIKEKINLFNSTKNNQQAE